jgi:hypothetical protein
MKGITKFLLTAGVFLLLAGMSPAEPMVMASPMAAAAHPAQPDNAASAHDRRNHRHRNARHHHHHRAHH